MSDVDWTAIRAEWEGGTSLRALASKYGVGKSVIGERKYKEQWTQNRTDSAIQGVPNRDANAALKAATAIQLRAKKLTYQEIATQCGYSDAKSCHRAVQRELQRVVVENVVELRREESLILDTLHASLWDRATNKDHKGQDFAADRVLETSKARRELMGLDVRPDEQETQQHYVKKIVIANETTITEVTQ